MLRALVIAGVIVAALGGGLVSGGTVSGKGPLRSLVDAERAFAARASEASTREAFAENLAPDAVVFRPDALNHHEWAAAHPDWGTKGLLTWDPSFGRTSSSGDFGYTTGPAQFRTTRDLSAEPVYWGYFVSVWSREGGDKWKVLIDTGTSTPKPDRPVARFEPVPAMERLPSPELADRRSGLDKLKQAEAAFASIVTEKGIGAAYVELLSENGRIHRDGHDPAVGRSAAAEVVDAKRTLVKLNFIDARVASSADLGYTFGNGEAKNADGSISKFAFLRIWETDTKKAWRIVLDVETAIPTGK